MPISASTTPLGLVATTWTATLASFRRPPRSSKPPNGGWRRAPGTSSVRVGDVGTLLEVITAPGAVTDINALRPPGAPLYLCFSISKLVQGEEGYGEETRALGIAMSPLQEGRSWPQ